MPVSRLNALHILYPNATTAPAPKSWASISAAKSKFSASRNSVDGALHREKDWTDSCVAVTDAEIEDIYPQVAVRTVVEIQP